jgi:CRP/FNR family cyclic AMP-dependent transcriptional regulator
MISPCTADFLAKSLWAAGLTPAQFSRVADDAREEHYPAGATVCRQGEHADHWVGVVDGMLKIETVSRSGRCSTFLSVPAGAWVGEGSVLKAEARPYGIVAMRRSTVGFIPRATFEWLIEVSPSFSRFLIDQLNARLGYFIALVESLRITEPAAQVAHCLSELFDPQLCPTGKRLLELSQGDLASITGLTRQNTNRALRDLEGAGILRRQYGAILVLDVPGLKAFGRSH